MTKAHVNADRVSFVARPISDHLMRSVTHRDMANMSKKRSERIIQWDDPLGRIVDGGGALYIAGVETCLVFDRPGASQ
jgi:hypothetical protein